MTLARRAVAEWLGSALLLAIVVGSGIMGDRLAGGNAAIALLANSVATGAGLYVLIVMLGPISGAHLNPVVSAAAALRGEIPAWDCVVYVASQVAGALAGVMLAHAMFELPLFQVSERLRPTTGETIGEIVATFGLVLTILLLSRLRSSAIPAAVAAFITSAYWFTSSTSFANPAVTLARSATDTFAGISPASVPWFICGQLMGGLFAAWVARWLLRSVP